MENAIEAIRKGELDSALKLEYRQYLTGHLQRPQVHLKHIEDDIEVGVSYYREFTADTPHVHPIATEYGYILQGTLRLQLLDGSHQEYEFYEGDFFLLRPNTPYATKSMAGTKILFMKSPGVNDKTLVNITEETEKWLSAWG